MLDTSPILPSIETHCLMELQNAMQTKFVVLSSVDANIRFTIGMLEAINRMKS